MTRQHILQPAGWPRPKGYSNGVAARGTVVAIAGQIGWLPDETWPADDFVGQTRQALQNLLAVLAEAGGGPEHIVRMTWYVTDKREYLAAASQGLGDVYRSLMRAPDGRIAFPAMTAVQVSALIEDRARVEIEATAVIPD